MKGRHRLYVVQNPRLSYDVGTIVWDGTDSTEDILEAARSLDNEILGPYELVRESVVSTDGQTAAEAVGSVPCQSSPLRITLTVHASVSADSDPTTEPGDAQ